MHDRQFWSEHRHEDPIGILPQTQLLQTYDPDTKLQDRQFGSEHRHEDPIGTFPLVQVLQT